MFLTKLKPFFALSNRKYVTIKNSFKVALVGGGGAIGQSMAMILKLSPLISELNLYDIRSVDGLAMDISHICSTSRVNSFSGLNKRDEALHECDIVIICCGDSKLPGMKHEDLFNANALIIDDLAKPLAYNCPNALIAIITDPINSLVPLLNESMEKAGTCDPKRVFGVPTLDVVRSKTLVAELKGKNPMDVHIPVIGGHSSETTIPVFSRASPILQLPDDELKLLTNRIKLAESDVVNAKLGSSHLSMAFAGSKFTFALCRALKGDKDIIECAYVKSNVTGVSYFSNPILLGKSGVEENLGLGKLSDLEEQLVAATIPILEKEIERGVTYTKK